LREYLGALIKKRGQSKKAIADMVDLAMKRMTELDKNELFSLLEVLRENTEGKIFVEAQYARCTKLYCELLIERKDLNKASEIIQEVQIETYGSLDRKEKLDFILYQVWIMYAKSDYVRMYIISKKIDPPHLNDKGLEEQKIKYYQLMILYYLNEGMHLEIAQAYKTMYDCLKANNDIETKLKIKQLSFENFIWFLLISPYTNHKIDMLHNAAKNEIKELEANPILNHYVSAFLLEEIYPIQLFEDVKSFEPFRKSESIQNPVKHFECLQKEFIQKDLKVVEKYYSRITIDRLAELCNVSTEIIEKEIADMVCNKRLRAKIDRIAKIVDFRRQMQPHDYLNDWNYDLKSMLSLVEETCHLINREHVINAK
jgi:26S proteasome regulatory subunit N5